MNMNLAANWEMEEALVDHLASQLVRGRLGLFLGAGLSSFYGLPEWKELVNRACEAVGEAKLRDGEDPIVKMSGLKARRYPNDDRGFNALIKTALYRDLALDFEQIRANKTLSAIGALVMASRRGSAAQVITLNYDDLLEIYLEFHGFVTASIWEDHHWANNDDVTIYHPHGSLPLATEDRADSDKIVLATRDYFEVMNSDFWKPLLQTILRTHTFIHIGLSGSDMHLQSLVTGIRSKHAIVADRFAFHSVRFSTKNGPDDVTDTLKAEGVFTHVLNDYENHLPTFLFKICQRARKLRIEAIG
jgi:hypothetical protein